MTERTFDRIPQYDFRSKSWPIRTLLPDKPARSYTWRHVQLDQGSEGACTGFSATMEAAARPVPVWGDPVRNPPHPDVLNTVARHVYHRAKQLDEWEGESYEGSSVLAACKAGLERGWWSEYRWALGPGAEAAANDVILNLGYKGPVMMGSWWWAGMMEADSDGYLGTNGRPVGGHAYLLTAYSKKRDAVFTPNSWGGAGQGWIRREHLVALLDDQGEAAIPVVRRMA